MAANDQVSMSIDVTPPPDPLCEHCFTPIVGRMLMRIRVARDGRRAVQTWHESHAPEELLR